LFEGEVEKMIGCVLFHIMWFVFSLKKIKKYSNEIIPRSIVSIYDNDINL